MSTAAPNPAPLGNLRALIADWKTGIRTIHIAHTRIAAHYDWWERWLGLSVAVIAAISGSTVFGAAGTASADRTLLFVAGVLAIAAAVAGAAHTFLRFGALSAEHAAAAKEYGVLRRDFEAKLISTKPEELTALLETVRARWNAIESKYRFVSQKRYAEAQQAVTKSMQREREAEGRAKAMAPETP